MPGWANTSLCACVLLSGFRCCPQEENTAVWKFSLHPEVEASVLFRDSALVSCLNYQLTFLRKWLSVETRLAGAE